MYFEHRFITENDSYLSPKEIRPEGVIIYSSGFPIEDWQLVNLYNRSNYRASVHALISAYGVLQTLPFNFKGMHTGYRRMNERYLGIKVCEPNSKDPKCQALRDQTRDNLVQFLVFLCRYLGATPVNVSEVIQFAGTANAKKVVAPEVLRPQRQLQPYFGRVGETAANGAEYCEEGSLLTAVKEKLEEITELSDEINTQAVTPLTRMGSDSVVLFTGGPLFKSRGVVACETFLDRMCHCVVTDYSKGSKHAYKVVFPDGSTYWVNRASLVRSTAGSISL